MQFKTAALSLLTVAAAGGTSAGQLRDPAVYARDMAPRELTWIREYRAQHGAALGADQEAVLDRIEADVRAAAADDLPGLERACDAAFGRAECKYLLTGRRTGGDDGSPGGGGGGGGGSSSRDRRAAAVAAAALGRRGAQCSCSDESDWCDTGFRCGYQADSCNLVPGMSFHFSTPSSFLRVDSALR